MALFVKSVDYIDKNRACNPMLKASANKKSQKEGQVTTSFWLMSSSMPRSLLPIIRI